MKDGRIKAQNDKVIPIIVGLDEAITRESLTLDADITSALMGGYALLKVKSSVTTGDIKVTLAGKNETAITVSYADVNEGNLHVSKVWKVGTTLAITDFYLWQ